jgi:hypothetical protein
MNRIRKLIRGETKIPARYNIFPKISIILVGLAVILLLIALSTDRNDFTTAMLIAVSLANLLSGIIIIAFTESKGIHPKISAMLYPSLITDKAGIFSGLNVYGDAHFIPKSMTDLERTLQFNPAGEYAGFDYKGSVFSIESEETAGIFSNPSSSALLKMFEDDHSLEIPLQYESENGFREILKGLLTEITYFCENVEISENDDEVIIKLINPVFTDGCREIRKESPKCCTVAPCPVCCLVCTIITEYFNKVTTLSTIRNDLKKGEILIIVKVLPHQPIDEDRGNLN